MIDFVKTLVMLVLGFWRRQMVQTHDAKAQQGDHVNYKIDLLPMVCLLNYFTDYNLPSFLHMAVCGSYDVTHNVVTCTA